MKLLVTGGSGFIGSNFIHYWFERHKNDEIINLDKLTYASNQSNLKGIEKYNYEFVKGDIADGKKVEKLVKDVDVVVNFAAETHVDNSIRDSKQFIHSNIVGVHVLVEAVRRYEKRIHQVSTDEVYGSLSVNSKRRFTESSCYRPNNPYSATKAAADHLVRAYFSTYKIKATVSNCGNNFGPRQHQEKLIPKTIVNALSGKKIPLYGKGMQIRDWIYTEDHCSAIERILDRGIYGETYLIGAENEKRNVDVVRAVLRELGKSENLISYVKDRPGHDARYAINPARIKREIGWKPRVGFDEGLIRTIAWYRENRGS